MYKSSHNELQLLDLLGQSSQTEQNFPLKQDAHGIQKVEQESNISPIAFYVDLFGCVAL